MEKISVQALNAIFHYLDISKQSALWISSTDYSKQVYINNTYDEVWQRPSEQLYRNPADWQKYIVSDYRYQEVIKKLYARNPEAKDIENDVVLYQIQKPNEEILYIKDKAFFVVNDQNQVVAVAGIAESITEQAWEACISQPQKVECDSKFSHIKKQLDHVFSKEFSVHLKAPQMHNSEQPKVKFKNSIDVSLTARESDCLYYLLQGKSAKQTAIALNISPRTVETYLESAKAKVRCRTKLELLANIELAA